MLSRVKGQWVLAKENGHYGRVCNFVAAANSDGSSDSPCQARFSSEMVVWVLQKCFSTLRARVKRIKNKLTGRMLFSEVAAALNRPLTTTEIRGSQIKSTDALLIPRQFWHDLRLIYAFEEPAIRVRNHRQLHE